MASAIMAPAGAMPLNTTRPNARGLRRDAFQERLALISLAAPALLIVVVTILVPVGWLFWLSFTADDGSLSLEHYRRMLEHPSYARTFRITFEASALTTAICIALGYPLAYVLSGLPRRIANLCLIGVLLPFWTSLLVRTYAWLVLLQRRGLINTWGMELGLWDEPLPLVHNLTGTVVGMVHIMLPFLVLSHLCAARAGADAWSAGGLEAGHRVFTATSLSASAHPAQKPQRRRIPISASRIPLSAAISKSSGERSLALWVESRIRYPTALRFGNPVQATLKRRSVLQRRPFHVTGPRRFAKQLLGLESTQSHGDK